MKSFAHWSKTSQSALLATKFGLNAPSPFLRSPDLFSAQSEIAQFSFHIAFWAGSLSLPLDREGMRREIGQTHNEEEEEEKGAVPD